MQRHWQELVSSVGFRRVVGDEEKRRQRSQRHHTQPEPPVDAVPAAIGEKAALGLETGLDSVNGEKGEVGQRPRARPTLAFVSQLSMASSAVAYHLPQGISQTTCYPCFCYVSGAGTGDGMGVKAAGNSREKIVSEPTGPGLIMRTISDIWC